MEYDLLLLPEAEATLSELMTKDLRKYNRVSACLAKLSHGPEHPGLQSHRYDVATGPHGEPVWESYVENRNPSAWRVWWYYGPEQGRISVMRIGPHPSSRERRR